MTPPAGSSPRSPAATGCPPRCSKSSPATPRSHRPYYNTRGALLWQGHSKRTATSTQLKALKALYGGCFACGADFDMCQAHHVQPVSEGGPTNVDNMVPACWGCHNKIHYFNWQIHGPPGKRTLHPPDTMNYGPAQGPIRRWSSVPALSTHPPNRETEREAVKGPGLDRRTGRDRSRRPRRRGAREDRSVSTQPRPIVCTRLGPRSKRHAATNAPAANTPDGQTHTATNTPDGQTHTATNTPDANPHSNQGCGQPLSWAAQV